MDSFWNKYPYSDFHELNLDWIINAMKKLEIEFDEFKVVNNITFSGQWDITKQYPAWTIVSDNNIGYVSQKPVPAGVPLTNGNYWVEVIDYTAQIAGLENRVIALENHDIVLDGQIIGINNNISRIDDELDLLNDGIYIYITDSYGLTTGNNPGDTETVPELLQALLKKDNNHFLSYAWSGCGFVGQNPTNFLDEFTAASASITDKDKVSKIIVCAGRNDLTYGTVDTNIASFVTYCNTNYPNAEVLIGYIGNGDNSAEGTVASQIDGFFAYKNCVEHGAIYLSGVENVLHDNALMYSDHVHPNLNGKKALAKYIYEALNSQYVVINGTYKTQQFTMKSGYALAAGTAQIEEYVANNALIADLGLIGVNTPATAISAYTVYNLVFGEIDKSTGYILGAYGAVDIPVNVCGIQTGSTDTHNLQGHLLIDANGNIAVRFISDKAFTLNAMFIYGTGHGEFPIVYC